MWSLLPYELLEKIFKTVDEIPGRVRFGAVCRLWRSVSRSAAGLPPQRLPWLLLHPSSSDDETVRTFLSLCNAKPYAVDIPEARKKLLFCSSSGWLLAVGPCSLTQATMLNPLTKARVTLPPVTMNDQVSRCKLYVTREARAAMVALVSGVIHCHENGWVKISVYDRRGKSRHPLDFAYHQGRCFILVDKGSVVSVGSRDKGRRVVVKAPPSATDRRGRWYLVPSSSGEEMFLVRAPSRGEGFEVFRLEQAGRRAGWARVWSVGGDVLFVDDHRATALPAAGHGCRENSVVFLDCAEGVARVMSFDVGGGGVQQLRAWKEDPMLRRPLAWFLPSMG